MNRNANHTHNLAIRSVCALGYYTLVALRPILVLALLLLKIACLITFAYLVIYRGAPVLFIGLVFVATITVLLDTRIDGAISTLEGYKT